MVWCCREDVGFKDLCYKDSSFLYDGFISLLPGLALLFVSFSFCVWVGFNHLRIPGQERKIFQFLACCGFSN